MKCCKVICYSLFKNNEAGKRSLQTAIIQTEYEIPHSRRPPQGQFIGSDIHTDHWSSDMADHLERGLDPANQCFSRRLMFHIFVVI
ncbi:hypothetical protein NPIL_116001 [Nephila pilipes]|uniref:Uncharacterized protein n=1 Tax=Nephila pilipes TaxID=299642 RepID=A0A8X6PLN6_NEPPI|nr:hypothetical protein NPIL_116001 [Nephila pilipes]